MGNNRRLKTLLIATALAVLPATADDSGLIVEAGASHKLSKVVSTSIDAEFRTRNDFRTVDRVSVGVDVSYKPLKFLKLTAAYSLLIDNNSEKLTFNEDGSYNNWRPSYYGTRHRIQVSATGEWKPVKRLKLSLRERWQYTHRGERDDLRRYDFDNEWWESTAVLSRNKHVLRSRLQASYDFPKWKFDPTASVEFFNTMSLEKTRLTFGTEYDIKKRHTLGIYYRYDIVRGDDDEDTNRHSIGVSYNFKF